MAVLITKVACFSAVTAGKLSNAAVLLGLARAGVDLIAFSTCADSATRRGLRLVAISGEQLRKAAARLGMDVAEERSAIIFRGEGPGDLATALDVLEKTKIEVTALEALRDRSGQLAGVIQVQAGQEEAAFKTLSFRAHLDAMVDEASSESFPASDAPAWPAPRFAGGR